MSLFNDKVAKLLAGHEALLMRKNEPVEEGNGVITRYRYPVLTAAHTPVFWRYDLNEETNPFLMERIGMNATLNAGAIKGWEVPDVGESGGSRPQIFFCCCRKPERY
mgnify:CR=1 FL=1